MVDFFNYLVQLSATVANATYEKIRIWRSHIQNCRRTFLLAEKLEFSKEVVLFVKCDCLRLVLQIKIWEEARMLF